MTSVLDTIISGDDSAAKPVQAAPEDASPPVENTDNAVCELLLRFELGQFDDRVRQRLLIIFSENPPDAWERSERACRHLRIDGSRLSEVADEAVRRRTS